MQMPPDRRQPPDNRGQGGPGGPQQVPRPLIPMWLYLLLIAGLLIWLFFRPGVGGQAAPQLPLTYSGFLDQVKAGNVADATIADQTVSGSFKSPVTGPVNPDTPVNPIASPQASQTPGAGATTTTYTRYTTTTPANIAPELVPLLEQNGVEIIAQDNSGGSFLTNLLLTLVLPFGLLIMFIFLMGRQARRGNDQLFGFGGSKARLYDVEQPQTTFADVAGIEESEAELQQVVDFLKEPGKYRALGARLPRGVLLIGPPGTGKTLLAKAVAGEAHVPFFSITGSEFVEMFVGVGASRVRDLFNKAKEAAPAIVFIDEIDAVGRQRGAGIGGGNDEREQTLNQMLAEMDGFDATTNVIVLAATNRPDVLDPALLRPGRFDRQITVGLPDRAGREAILRIHTKKLKMSNDVNLDMLSKQTPGFSGADLANLANEAALSAARRNVDAVYMRDFGEAMDKIILGTKQATVLNPTEKRVVAYHEGGHALVAKLTPGADPVTKVTIIPHGRALGVTQQTPEEDRHNYPKDYLLNRLAVMLGGRAAEKIVFQQPTTGAEADLKGASDLARRIVGLWGMSDELGPVYYGIGETDPFLGREMAAPKQYAESTASAVDDEVRKLLEDAQKQAIGTLTNFRSLLDQLAEELVNKESVDGAWIDELLRRNGVTPAPTTTLPPTTSGVMYKAPDGIE